MRLLRTEGSNTLGMEIPTLIKTGRQAADRQTIQQADGETDRQVGRQAVRQVDR